MAVKVRSFWRGSNTSAMAGQCIIQVLVLRPHDVLDGAEHADDVVRRRNQGYLLHIGPYNKAYTSVRIPVIAAVLSIVLDH